MNADDDYIPKGVPTEAIKDLWVYEKSRIGCYKYSRLILLKSMIDTVEDILKDDKDNKYGKGILDYFNRDMKGKDIPGDITKQAYWKLEEKESGYTKDDLLPGDQVWFYNPYYYKLTEKEKENSKYRGDQGSNVFYIGDGNVVEIYGKHRVFTIEDYQKHLAGWNSVKRFTKNAKASDFPIQRRLHPIW